MLVSISHIIFTFLSIVIAAGVFGSYIGGHSKSKKLKRFAIFFVLFASYQLFFSYFLFFDNLYFAAWSYNLAIIVAFIMFAFILSVILSILGVTRRNRSMVYLFVLLTGVAVVGMQIYDFRLPVVKESGFIDWNANKLAARMTSLSAFLISLIWVYALLVNISSFHGHPRKLKAILLASGGLSLGLSGLTTYHTYEESIAIASHIFAFIGGFLILSTLLAFNNDRER